MDLRDYLDILRRRWLSAVIVTVATLAVAMVGTFLTTPQFTATTRLFFGVQGGESATDLAQDAELAALLLPDGHPIKPGTRLRRPDYAESLRLIAQYGAGHHHRHGHAVIRRIRGRCCIHGGQVLGRRRECDHDCRARAAERPQRLLDCACHSAGARG